MLQNFEAPSKTEFMNLQDFGRIVAVVQWAEDWAGNGPKEAANIRLRLWSDWR